VGSLESVVDGLSVTFTDTELNAFFDKWSNFQNWKEQYQH